MKNQYFEKIENKYVFNLSRIFWHFFIAMGTLAIIVGLFVLVYSLVPSFKTKVAKTPYPSEVQVALSDIQEPAAPVAAPSAPQTTQATTPVQAPAAVAVSNDPDKPQYDALLKQLELLIPPAKYSWDGTGHYVYPFGENFWNFYHQDKYRVFVKTGGGIVDNLNEVYERSDSYSYKNKAALLQSYINILTLLNEETRMTWLNNLIGYTGNNRNNALGLFSKLSISASKFPKDNLSYLYTLINFSQQNKNDGFPFIDMVNDVIAKFDMNYRAEVLNNLVDAHNIIFNNNVPKQHELTEGFLSLISNFKGEQQPRALMRYYKVYLGKNREREATVAEIETKFNIETANAEVAYQVKKSAKQTLRWESMASIGAGIAFVSIIAILLVFLAIQRSVKRIEDNLPDDEAPVVVPPIPPVNQNTCNKCDKVNTPQDSFCTNCGNKL